MKGVGKRNHLFPKRVTGWRSYLGSGRFSKNSCGKPNCPDITTASETTRGSPDYISPALPQWRELMSAVRAVDQGVVPLATYHQQLSDFQAGATDRLR
jgi:hypothetical protein